MKKNVVLYVLIAFLICVNGFYLYKDLKKPNAKGHPNNPVEFIVKELNFNDAQLKQFQEMRIDHQKRMMKMDKDERQLKESLFGKISSETIDQREVDSIATLIGENRKSKDLEIFNHFRTIEELCNDKQKQKFKRIIMDALHKGPPPGNRRGPGNQNQGPPPRN